MDTNKALISRGATKRRAQKKKFPKKGKKANERLLRPYWFLILLSGICIGLALSSNQPLIKTPRNVAKAEISSSKSNTNNKKDSEQTAANEYNYDFYKLLPEISSFSVQKKADSKTLDLKSNKMPINKYMVQAGSFRKYTDAEQLRARLTLNGFETQIASITLNNGSKWHRVNIGPFDSIGSAEIQRDLLEDQLINDALIIRLTG